MRWVRAFVGVLAILLAASCGLPDASTPQQIEPSLVPYRLLSPSVDGPATPDRGSPTTIPRVYFLTGGDRLVAVATPLARHGLVPVVDALLGRLVEGPTEPQRAAGLGSALGAGVQLRLKNVSGRTAFVELDTGEQDPAASRLPLAVGQVVLTAASVEGVDAVRFVRDGSPAEVPLPSGALTSSPVTPDDYGQLAVARPRESDKADPRPVRTASG